MRNGKAEFETRSWLREHRWCLTGGLLVITAVGLLAVACGGGATEIMATATSTPCLSPVQATAVADFVAGLAAGTREAAAAIITARPVGLCPTETLPSADATMETLRNTLLATAKFLTSTPTP